MSPTTVLHFTGDEERMSRDRCWLYTRAMHTRNQDMDRQVFVLDDYDDPYSEYDDHNVLLRITPNAGPYRHAKIRFALNFAGVNYPIEQPSVICQNHINHPNINMTTMGPDTNVCVLYDWNPRMNLVDLVCGILYVLHNPDPPVADEAEVRASLRGLRVNPVTGARYSKVLEAGASDDDDHPANVDLGGRARVPVENIRAELVLGLHSFAVQLNHLNLSPEIIQYAISYVQKYAISYVQEHCEFGRAEDYEDYTHTYLKAQVELDAETELLQRELEEDGDMAGAAEYGAVRRVLSYFTPRARINDLIVSTTTASGQDASIKDDDGLVKDPALNRLPTDPPRAAVEEWVATLTTTPIPCPAVERERLAAAAAADEKDREAQLLEDENKKLVFGRLVMKQQEPPKVVVARTQPSGSTTTTTTTTLRSRMTASAAGSSVMVMTEPTDVDRMSLSDAGEKEEAAAAAKKAAREDDEEYEEDDDVDDATASEIERILCGDLTGQEYLRYYYNSCQLAPAGSSVDSDLEFGPRARGRRSCWERTKTGMWLALRKCFYFY